MGTWRDAPFLGAFDRREIFIFLGAYYKEIERHEKEVSVNGQLSP